MIITLKPTADEVDELLALIQRNLDSLANYDPEHFLTYEIPFSDDEFAIAQQIKSVLQQGGRVLLLTPDSDVPQELVTNNEN